MPRKATHHQTVVAALIADGWTITNDPLRVAYGFLDVYVDLAAELPIGAERGTQQIAVEVKSFVGASDIHDLETALGQYIETCFRRWSPTARSTWPCRSAPTPVS